MGAVTDVVRRLVPASYRAMTQVTNSPQLVGYYTVADLQSLADYVKFRLFSTSVSAASESTHYDPLLINFLGKLTALQFIPAAIDYWGDQLLSESTTGTSEVITYPDRRPELWKLFKELQRQTQEEFTELGPKYGFKIYGTGGLIPQISYGDNGRGILITPDPADFGTPFGPIAPYTLTEFMKFRGEIVE